MAIKIQLSQTPAFEAALHESAPSGSTLTVITKQGATTGGLPSVVLAFQSQVKGEIVAVQYQLTLREMLTLATGLAAHHEAHDPAWAAADRPRFGIVS